MAMAITFKRAAIAVGGLALLLSGGANLWLWGALESERNAPTPAPEPAYSAPTGIRITAADGDWRCFAIHKDASALPTP